MALPESPQKMTEAEYLAFEHKSDVKYEYVDGEIFAMSGASEIHNLIAAGITAALLPRLRGKGCVTYPSDMKVRNPVTRTYMYPDVTVVCGDRQFDDEDRHVLLNPTVIFEVLSPSTESYDRGAKFRNYRRIPSLQVYVLVTQDQPVIECFTRQNENEWLLSVAEGSVSMMELPFIGVALPLAEVYQQVEFTADEGLTVEDDPPM